MGVSERDISAERAELEALLASGVFARAPALAHMLTYVCERSFEGEAEAIKEYNIAVEAFHRGPDFDQKRDSIVRVEAHRLRKRLKEYYATEGASHALRIEIPSGAYAPVFVPNQVQPVIPSAPPPPAPPPARRPWWPAAALIALIVLGVAGYSVWQWRGAVTVSVEPGEFPNLHEVRISCGAPAPFTDRRGHMWISDRYYEGGRAVQRPAPGLQGTLTPEAFASYREGSFRYSIPLKPGVYEMRLYFAEPSVASVTDRLFDLRVNGQDVLTEFDILAESGSTESALVKVWRDIEPTEDGILKLEFVNRRAGALLNAIELTPGIRGRLRPIRIAAREEPYTDSNGILFAEDHHFNGGKLVRRLEGINGTEDPELYRGERFGHFAYAIPVPPDSTYTAVLHFAETWFGATGEGGAGSRIFDVYCNGARLLVNFDPLAEIGRPLLATHRTFNGLRPTPNGKLLFQFVPSRNYAMINAIEILDEAGDAPAGQSSDASSTR
jgi:hypothetical protein